jgi:hypothetical protein
MSDMIQEKVGGHFFNMLDKVTSLNDENDHWKRNFIGHDNEYYPFPEKSTSLNELCTGVQSKEYHLWFDESRFVFTAALNKDHINVDDFCDSNFS